MQVQIHKLFTENCLSDSVRGFWYSIKGMAWWFDLQAQKKKKEKRKKIGMKSSQSYLDNRFKRVQVKVLNGNQ